MGNEIELGQSPRVAEIQERREAITEANANPLPGALKDAFAIAPNIKVDKWEVRPFYDGDYDILVALDNPLGKLMESKFNGVETPPDYILRGQTLWELCYLFTNPIRQCDKEVQDGTFKAKAKDAFFEYRIEALILFHNAVMQQLAIYWSTTIGHGAADEPVEGEVKKKQ